MSLSEHLSWQEISEAWNSKVLSKSIRWYILTCLFTLYLYWSLVYLTTSCSITKAKRKLRCQKIIKFFFFLLTNDINRNWLFYNTWLIVYILNSQPFTYDLSDTSDNCSRRSDLELIFFLNSSYLKKYHETVTLRTHKTLLNVSLLTRALEARKCIVGTSHYTISQEMVADFQHEHHCSC